MDPRLWNPQYFQYFHGALEHVDTKTTAILPYEGKHDIPSFKRDKLDTYSCLNSPTTLSANPTNRRPIFPPALTKISNTDIIFLLYAVTLFHIFSVKPPPPSNMSQASPLEEKSASTSPPIGRTKREGNDSLWKRARRTLGTNSLTFLQPTTRPTGMPLTQAFPLCLFN